MKLRSCWRPRFCPAWAESVKPPGARGTKPSNGYAAPSKPVLVYQRDSMAQRRRNFFARLPQNVGESEGQQRSSGACREPAFGAIRPAASTGQRDRLRPPKTTRDEVATEGRTGLPILGIGLSRVPARRADGSAPRADRTLQAHARLPALDCLDGQRQCSNGRTEPYLDHVVPETAAFQCAPAKRGKEQLVRRQSTGASKTARDVCVQPRPSGTQHRNHDVRTRNLRISQASDVARGRWQKCPWATAWQDLTGQSAEGKSGEKMGEK